jgi:hypothetical protein
LRRSIAPANSARASFHSSDSSHGSFIRTGQGYIGHFVGSDDKPPPRFDNRTDDIKTGLVINGTGELVFATVQLFADLGGPVYVVIAGMLTDQSSRVDYSGQENVDAVSI